MLGKEPQQWKFRQQLYEHVGRELLVQSGQLRQLIQQFLHRRQFQPGLLAAAAAAKR